VDADGSRPSNEDVWRFDLSREQIERFHQDGFLLAERLLDEKRVADALDRFAPLFRGEFETGVPPDEVNWLEGRDDPSLTRQICNGWKADRKIARVVLDRELGKACAILGNWPGARLLQDNVLWKPPGARSLGFHQDDAYLDWFDPGELITCWVALDATTADGGTLELAKGSHRWGRFNMASQFHAPKRYREGLYGAVRRIGKDPELVNVVAAKGGGSFHHGRTFHGSGPNRSEAPRRVLTLHCCSSQAQYHPGNLAKGTGRVYSRYKRLGDNIMDETYFPILWTVDGHRTAGLDQYCAAGHA